MPRAPAWRLLTLWGLPFPATDASWMTLERGPTNGVRYLSISPQTNSPFSQLKWDLKGTYCVLLLFSGIKKKPVSRLRGLPWVGFHCHCDSPRLPRTRDPESRAGLKAPQGGGRLCLTDQPARGRAPTQGLTAGPAPSAEGSAARPWVQASGLGSVCQASGLHSRPFLFFLHLSGNISCIISEKMHFYVTSL